MVGRCIRLQVWKMFSISDLSGKVRILSGEIRSKCIINIYPTDVSDGLFSHVAIDEPCDIDMAVVGLKKHMLHYVP